MKRIVVIFLLFVMLLKVQAQPTCLLVVYNGKNLVLTQKHHEKRKSTYPYTITINGKAHQLACIDDTVQVNFSLLGYKAGDSLTVQLMGGTPGLSIDDTVAFAIHYKFKCERIYVEMKDTTLRWKSIGETGPTYYAVQQFRWQHWVNLETVRSSANADSAFGQLNLKKYLHYGQNKFRIRTARFNAGTEWPEASVNDTTFADTELKKHAVLRSRPVKLKRPTLYELYDRLGNIVSRGYGSMIFTNRLQRGHYYINYEHYTQEIEIQ